jgi:hypothetical protein
MTAINSWRAFRRVVRASGEPLFGALGRFPDAVLVSGCQRSGTTILARIIAGTDGFSRYAITTDDELDAALILAGRLDVPNGRYCFQTTYMYDGHDEYRRLQGQRLVWVVRNPASVVYSMLYNWKRSALNELFMGCGTGLLAEPWRLRLQRFGILGVPPVRRACLSYASKTAELARLRAMLPPDRVVVLDYDDVVAQPGHMLGALYDSLGLQYRAAYGMQLHDSSRAKAAALGTSERELIARLCEPAYEQARQFITIGRRS